MGSVSRLANETHILQRTVSDNGDRRLVYGSAYAAIERTILDESEKIKRELDEEDEVLVEASFVV